MTTTLALKSPRTLTVLVLALVLAVGCGGNPSDSRAKQGAKSGAAVGAGIGLLLGVLSGDAEVAVAATAIGAASGAARGGYEGWRQDQDDERTRQITDAIREQGAAQARADMDNEARTREELTRFLGVWNMEGFMIDTDGTKVNVSAQVNGTVKMNQFVEMAWIDLKADGFSGQVWGTSTMAYDSDNGFSLNTMFNTLEQPIEVDGGSFNSAGRTFTFADALGTTTITFQNPDQFSVTTTVSGDTVESYRFTRG